MTLLVACVEGDTVWMISDTAVTNPGGDLRAREHLPKIETIGENAIAGFAGDVFHGRRAIRALSNIAPGGPAREYLLAEHRKYPAVSFAYAHVADSRPALYKIDDGSCAQTPTLYLGEQAAFENFQRLRHRKDVDAAPNARGSVVLASYLTEEIPAGLQSAIAALFAHMSSTTARTVGGWVVPLLLAASGARLAPYSLVVSDPIADQLKAGEVIPFGTARGGGFSFSLTEMSDRLGMVAYWLQARSGIVLVRSPDWYEQTRISGAPEEFRANVESLIGRRVELWFGGDAIAAPEKIHLITDEDGKVRQAIVQQDQSFETTMMDFEGKPFISRIGLDLRDKDGVENSSLTISLSDDKKQAQVQFAGPTMNLDAPSLERVIQQLGKTRSQMGGYPDLVKGSNVRIDAAIDPKWRTLSPPHPTVPGPLLNLLHPDFGWVGFVLPDKEARVLAEWLLTDVKSREKPKNS